MAIGYEGRDEIMRAIRKMLKDRVSSDTVTIDSIKEYLDTTGQSDLDLLIRTGGEKRTSGFLVWQAADAEFYFTNTFMPDFTVERFQAALDDFAGRERRMGGDSKAY